jgi:hypothetical protein
MVVDVMLPGLACDALEVSDLRLDAAVHRAWQGGALIDSLCCCRFSFLEFLMFSLASVTPM